MNPWVIKVGIGVIASAATLLYVLWKNSQHEQQNEHIPTFDWSSIKSCRICLLELDTFKDDVVCLPCKHRFHRTCITTEFSHRGSEPKLCPLCRRIVGKRF